MIFSIIVAVIFILFFGFGFPTILFLDFVPNYIFNISGGNYLLSAVNNFIAFVVILLFLKAINLYKNISWNIKGIPKALMLGFLFIIFTVVQFYLIYLNTPDKLFIINWTGLACSVIYCFSIGMWEELLCRGLILTNMIKKWGYNSKGIFKSIIFSAAIFGVAHIITGIGGNMTASLIQVCYATIMGILLGAIYVKTKSLDGAIILHVILNLSAYLMAFILPNSYGIDGVSFIAILFIFGIFWILMSYFITINIHKKDCEELINEEIIH